MIAWPIETAGETNDTLWKKSQIKSTNITFIPQYKTKV